MCSLRRGRRRQNIAHDERPHQLSFDFLEEEADLVLDTEEEGLEVLIEKVVRYLEKQEILQV